jgi:hypothetical protein
MNVQTGHNYSEADFQVIKSMKKSSLLPHGCRIVDSPRRTHVEGRLAIFGQDGGVGLLLERISN